MAGKRNRFARTGLDFIRACRRIKMNFKSEDIQFASLEQVMGTLSHLRKKEGVVFETKLPILAGMGDQCYPFARDVRFPLEPEIFSLTYSWFDMDILHKGIESKSWSPFLCPKSPPHCRRIAKTVFSPWVR